MAKKKDEIKCRCVLSGYEGFVCTAKNSAGEDCSYAKVDKRYKKKRCHDIVEKENYWAVPMVYCQNERAKEEAALAYFDATEFIKNKGWY